MKKLLSIILTVCMLFSLVIVPLTVNAEETPTVTLQYLDGTTATAEVTDEGKIVYPALAAEINVDHVWSVNEKKYEVAPETATADITVYELKTNVLSFENYPVAEYTSEFTFSEEAVAHKGAIICETEINTSVSNEEAYTGDNSIKLRDHNVRLRATEPANWSTSAWKDHYGFNEETKKWEKLTGSTAPTFEPFKYAYERYRDGYESGMTIVKRFEKEEIPVTAEYLVTFKYKATANNLEASTLRARIILEQNLQWGTPRILDGSFSFPAGATNGWKEASFTIKANAADADSNGYGYDQVLDLQWVYGGSQYKKEIFIDDIRVVNVNDLKGVTYVAPDGSTQFIEYEVGDTIEYPTTNPGGATNYNNHYVWSSTADTYTAVPTTFTENTSVYWVASDVIKFQHDIPTLDMVYDPAKYPNASYVNEGYDDNRSIRIRNYLVRDTNVTWTEANCVNYQYYDEATDSYKQITVDMYNECNGNYDEFVAKYGKARQPRTGGIEQSNIPVHQYNSTTTPIKDNAKITFKYKFTGKNAGNGVKVYAIIANSNTANWGSVKFTSQAIMLPTNTSAGWQTVSLYTVIDSTTMTNQDKKAVLALRFVDAANETFASTFTILVDDIKYETFENTPTVILHNGDEVTKVTEGLVAGEEYTPAAPTAPEGKYFARWATAPGGYDFAKTISIPAADSGKSLVVEYYAIFRDIPPFVYGDCNGDSEIKTDDLAALKLYLVNLGEVTQGADCNGDGEIKTDDLAALKLFLVGLNELGPEE